MTYFATKDLAVGYDGNVLIHDINIDIEKGKILTLIGPNGAGKSTILKSVTRHLAKLGGQVWMDGHREPGENPGRYRRCMRGGSALR